MLLLSAAQKRSSGEHAQGRIDAGIPADKYTDEMYSTSSAVQQPSLSMYAT